MFPRINNVSEEHQHMLLPIEGYEKVRLMTIDEAIQPLIPLFPEASLEEKVWVAKQRCRNPDDGLTQDESVSIMLYTIEWTPSEQSLYAILNKSLREENRNILKPWFPYLRLFISALLKLPPVYRIVYRGMKGDMTKKYSSDENSVWWGFSSCTDKMKVLESDQFCGKTGIRTIFNIECIGGRSIRNHSYYPEENEIILLPGRYLRPRSIDHYTSDDGLCIIQLYEIDPPYPLLKLPDNNPWRRFAPGLSLLGKCLNSDCIANRKEVIVPIGLGDFDVLIDTNATTSKCPICARYVEISKLGFSECQWRIDGIKQISSEAPFTFSEGWSHAPRHSLLEYNLDGFNWRQLKVKTKPQDSS